MSYNKKSSYEMPIENKVRAQARIDEITKRQKSDFDKAVAAEVGIALRTLLNDATLSLYDYQREALGHLIEKKESGATPLINTEKSQSWFSTSANLAAGLQCYRRS
jgi:dsDNA-binding SOS-regulon protein